MNNTEELVVEEKAQNAPEYDFDRREMMRYRVNGTSYKFGLLAMVFSLLGAFICLNSMNPNDFQVIIIILLNVVILLGGFLAAEKIKAYDKRGAIAQLVFGGVCIGRMFYIPLVLLLNFHKFINSLQWNEEFERWDILEDQAEAHDAALKHLGATITSKYGGTVANAYLPASGYFRGISAMVLFALAAACFIYAGLVGLKRAKTLDSYMETLKKE